MPTPKQMEELVVEAARKPPVPAAAPDAPLPAEYWESVLKDPRASTNGVQMRQRRLSEIQRHVLRVSCRRCERAAEIKTVDAVRLYGGKPRRHSGNSHGSTAIRRDQGRFRGPRARPWASEAGRAAADGDPQARARQRS